MKRKFILCINHGGYPESLEKRKFYEVLQDSEAEREEMYRIIDESGQDYLYSKNLFLMVNLPEQLEAALLEAA